MQASIAFHGAARTVTGSKHLLTLNGKKILIDCGLFQGSSELRRRNWQDFGFDPRELDAVVLTHAHNDHIGLLPKLMREGFEGPIYATATTIGLCRISLPDSGRLQEEEARRHNKYGTSKHSPAMPLYTEQDAYAVLKQMERVPFQKSHPLPGGASFMFHPAGHILGAGFAEIKLPSGETLLMGGDLGRYGARIIRDPETIPFAEYLVVESTYGDRLHAQEDANEIIAEVFQDAFRTGGVVLVPSFAIGRTQELLYIIHELEDAGRIPRIPIFVDSPMAVSVTSLYANAREEYDEEMLAELAMGHEPLEPANVELIRDREQSKALNSRRGPMVIISGSGMANGGRIVHHLLQRLDDPATTVLFTGYQGEGTLGRRLVDGADRVSILGHELPVGAKIRQMGSLSAHADQGEIMRWLGGFQRPPRRTFIVHGEPAAQEALAAKIRAELGWELSIPEQGEEFELA